MSRERGLCAEWWSDFVLCGVGLGLGLWWRANELVERKYCELNNRKELRRIHPN